MRRLSKAFSLVELAISLTVIGLIMGSMVVSIDSILQLKYRYETASKLRAIDNAIMNYFAKNMRLPCPARLNAANSSSNFGAEMDKTGNNCNTQTDEVVEVGSGSSFVQGGVPFKALGLDPSYAFDAFGARVEYVVPHYITNQISGSNFIRNDVGGGVEDFDLVISSTNYNPRTTGSYGLIIKDKAGTTKTAKAVYAIISHGANKFGAVNKLGLRISTQSTSPDSTTENCNIYDSAGRSTSTICQDEINKNGYDDIVVFHTLYDIIRENSMGWSVRCPDKSDTPALRIEKKPSESVKSTCSASIQKSATCYNWGVWSDILESAC